MYQAAVNYICQQVTSTRKNQSDRIVNADKTSNHVSLSITAVIIIHVAQW